MTNREELPILVDQALSAYSMLEGARLILVGLSGGADSVALTHYLRFGRGLPLLACHVNHNLRGRESLRDEEFVRALCDQWKIPLVVKSVWLDRYAAQKGLGLEEAGREVRYRFFGQVMKANGANRAATAHTASDNLETLLLNLARGTARKGLCGIPPVRPMLTEGIPPNSMIRPLILCSREDVEDYCLHNGLSYVIDSSNMQDDYARNKLRHRVIPVLRGLNPEAVRAVSRTTAIFREEEACLDRAARQLLENSRDGDGLSHPLLKKEPGQGGRRSHQGVEGHDPHHGPVRVQRRPRLPEHPCQGGGEGRRALPGPACLRLGQGQRRAQAHGGHSRVHEVGHPPAQQHRGPGQQHGPAVAETEQEVLQGGKLQIALLSPCLEQGFVGDGLPGAGLEVIGQSGSRHGSVYPRYTVGDRHQQGGQGEHGLAEQEGAPPAQQVGQQPGGRLPPQADHVEQAFRQSDLHQGKAPQGEQQHPHAARRVEAGGPLQQQEGPLLPG